MYALPNLPGPCCGTCKFFAAVDGVDISDDAEEYGKCVRNPPTFFHRKLLNGEWPVVHFSRWCGEYRHDIGSANLHAADHPGECG